MSEENFVPPKAPKDLCFSELDFVQKVFDVDVFLQEHRKNVTLERMRDDLGVYSKTLRSAMIELINRDYADFVNLASNLIGLDTAIEYLERPLGQLKEEVMEILQCLDDAINEMSTNLCKRQQIRTRKKLINNLIRINKSIDKLYRILNIGSVSDRLVNPDILIRASLEFIQLNYNANQCKSHLPPKQQEKIVEIEQYLISNLNELLVKYINDKNEALLMQCLNIYNDLQKFEEAENIVRKKIVLPVVESIISENNLQSELLGLKGIYQKLDKVFDESLKNLLNITMCPDSASIKGFNFLVNSFWVEVEERIENYLSIIFAPGNPDLFHKRYIETIEFLLKLEKRCGTPENVKLLKSHSFYQRFITKWNLPVYYQIRFQEIAGTAESIFCGNISSHSIRKGKEFMEPDNFSLHATCIIWDCLLRIWDEEVYLPQLLHRFWKLSLQLCSRYRVWCASSLKQAWMVTEVVETRQFPDSGNSKRLEFLVCLYTDVEKLASKMSQFLDVISPKLSNISPNVREMLEETLKENNKYLEECMPIVTEEIVKELLEPCAVHLKQISDIPRLFRRTNREVPTKPCAYVKNSLNFLKEFHGDYNSIIPQNVKQWLQETLSSLTIQYMTSVTDVLTSVQKTEESLRRLKKIRDKSAGVSPAEGQGVSDDEKIRIQLHTDVINYIQMVKNLDLSEVDVKHLQELSQVVETAIKSKNESK